MNAPPADVRELLAQAVRALAATSDSARLDAELLLAAVLGGGRASLYAAPERAVAPAVAARYRDAVARRARGEPLAYITGEREFWSLPLAVDARVLVPRPETELLVELALAGTAADSACDVVDLGTGSGAIALALAQARPRWRLLAIDRAWGALEVARANARRLALPDVRFLASDWFAAIGAWRFDLALANPPYVASDDPVLAGRELASEPRFALDGGADGLAAIRRIVGAAPAHLRPAGALLVEHGADQGAAVRALFAAHGFVEVATARDLAGHERVTHGRRPVAERGA